MRGIAMASLYRYAFDAQFVPDHLLHRDHQLDEIRKMLSVPGLHIYGVGNKGNGKTITGMAFKRDLEERGIRVVYLRSCRAILSAFKEAVGSAIGERLQQREDPFKKLLEGCSESVFVILDDAQEMLKYPGQLDSLLRPLYNTAAVGHDFHLLALGTIQRQRFINALQLDVQSRYVDFHEVYFPNYKMEEIEAILKQRLDYLKLGYNLMGLKMIAAKVSDMAEDLRLALDILKRACARAKANVVEIDDVETAWVERKTDYWAEQLRDMSGHERMLIRVATEECLKTGSNEIDTLELNRKYKDVLRAAGYEPLLAQGVYKIIERNLVPTGWFSFKSYVWKGRHGRGRILIYENNPKTIHLAFEKYSDRLLSLEGMAREKQTTLRGEYGLTEQGEKSET
jgi:Cdc6-like AAA superfamily ATPase